jgi:hypothetical protein
MLAPITVGLPRIPFKMKRKIPSDCHQCTPGF